MILSIGMIVKNEEKYLKRCLTALKPILESLDSELIIADTGSTDSTVEIAKRFTDNVFHFEWINDFAAARNSTLKKAQGEWYMFIDADEILKDCTDIIRFFKSGEYKEYGSATYIVRSYSDSQRADVYSDFRAYRLTIKRNDVTFVNPVHEGLAPPVKPCKNLDLIADHYGYLYYDNGVLNELSRQKSERNIKMLTEELAEQEASGKVRAAIHNQLADCYDVMGMTERSLEHVNKGFEIADPENIFVIMYYNHKFSLLLKLERYNEIIELSEKYFSKENKARRKPLSSDCYVYAVRGIAYRWLNDISAAIRNFMLSFECYCKYVNGELVTEDLLMGPFRASESFMKSCYDYFLKCCVYAHEYDMVGSAMDMFPLRECLADREYMLMHLSLRVEIMEHTSYSELADLYYKLDEYNKKQLIRIMRWRFFKTDKYDQIINKMRDIVIADQHLMDTLEVYRRYYVEKSLTSELTSDYIAKYSALENEDIWCVMMLAGYDVAPYITDKNFNSERCVCGVYINYMDSCDAADLFANYDITAVSDSGLQSLASVYGWALIGAGQNKLDITMLFEKFGQIGIRWYNAFPGSTIIPADIKAAIMVNNIVVTHRKRDFDCCMREMRRLELSYPPLAPIVEKYREIVEYDAKPVSSSTNSEFNRLAIQVKQNIREMMRAGQLAEAKSTLLELEELCPLDPEIEKLKDELYELRR